MNAALAIWNGPLRAINAGLLSAGTARIVRWFTRLAGDQ